MPATKQRNEVVWINTAEAARLMGLSPQTLCNWRATKDPRRPRCHNAGRFKRYKTSVIEAWIEANREED